MILLLFGLPHSKNRMRFAVPINIGIGHEPVLLGAFIVRSSREFGPEILAFCAQRRQRRANGAITFSRRRSLARPKEKRGHRKQPRFLN